MIAKIGMWHWVRMSQGEWFPAYRDENAAGGWTNRDTWEDYDGRVTEWRELQTPPDNPLVPPIARPATVESM